MTYYKPPLHEQMAYQQLLSGQLEESYQGYKKAFSLDETSLSALGGVIHCQILQGQLAEAEQQLEFLTEVQPLHCMCCMYM